MNLVDSSGWLEFLADGPGAEHFAGPLHNVDELLVPTISIHEVFKCVLRERGPEDALSTAALMRQGRVVDLTDTLAMDAARLGLRHRLPMADSIIYATARAGAAILWTQDADFAELPGVRYFPK